MSSAQCTFDEGLLQAYYDRELEEALRKEVEAHLADCPVCCQRLEQFGRLSGLLGVLAGEKADELAVRRSWDKIAGNLQERPRAAHAGVRRLYWLGLPAAAVLAFLLLHPFSGAGRANECVVESIDCSYAGFMLLRPQTERGCTIIWINDRGSETR